jgi:hypothetical protein
MKLSRIIELALIRFYGADYNLDQFMCNAVDTLRRQGMITAKQKDEAVKHIENMLLVVYPQNQEYTLLNALKRAGYLPDNEVYKNMGYTTQLYVWWVFDLKNKGL